MGECIREAQAAGEIESDADPDVLAAFVLNAWEGAVLRARIEKGTAPSGNSSMRCSPFSFAKPASRLPFVRSRMTGHLDTLVLARSKVPAPFAGRPRLWAGGVALIVLLAAGAAILGPKWLHKRLGVRPGRAATAASGHGQRTGQRDLASWTTFTGQFSAVDYVELRAQVSGYLTEIHFTDGQIVHKGDLLFVIDPRPYDISLQQAAAQLQTAVAGLDLANKEIVRTTELRRNDFASGELLDQRVQQQRAAQAAVEQAKAAVRTAQLNLEFTRITAPLTGRISAHRASIGNLIQPAARLRLGNPADHDRFA